jgi:hypothetical protein
MAPWGVCEKDYAFTVNNPLTLIKGTLPTRFSSICQTIRMGFGSAA